MRGARFSRRAGGRGGCVLCVNLAHGPEHIGQLSTQIACNQQAGGAQPGKFALPSGRAHQQPGLAAAFNIHDRAHIEGQVKQLLGKGVGLYRLAAVQKENTAVARLRHSGNGVVWAAR